MESTMLDMIREKTAMLNDNKSKLTVIEQDQAIFREEQQRKIN